MSEKMDLFSDNSERVRYNSPYLPVYVRRGNLSTFENLSAVSHWHDDVEFLAVLSGHLSYRVNDSVCRVEEGGGIFVNSRQLHYGFSQDSTDCEYVCALLHPILLCSNDYVERSFVAPVTENSALEYAVLSRKIPWQAAVCAAVREMYDSCIREERSFGLKAQELFFRVWFLLYEHMPQPPEGSLPGSQQMTGLKAMVGFIQKHYRERLLLDNIARAGSACKSNCCAVFRRYLHQTPIQYLTSYRLNKSIDLLRDPQLNITEIAFQSGFSGASYYTETFRKQFGCTPTEYRKQLHDNSEPGKTL